MNTRKQDSWGPAQNSFYHSCGARTGSERRGFARREFVKPLLKAGDRHRDRREEVAWDEPSCPRNTSLEAEGGSQEDRSTLSFRTKLSAVCGLTLSRGIPSLAEPDQEGRSVCPTSQL